LNIARDAGTYLYNAQSPWENSLAGTQVHNTVTVNGTDQFTRAGRFLFLDRRDAYRKTLAPASTTGLQKMQGLFRSKDYRHTRTVSVDEHDGWLVEDEILLRHPFWKKGKATCRLHWLLPDWKWETRIEEYGYALRLRSPHGWVTLNLRLAEGEIGGKQRFSIARAGELLCGEGRVEPNRGWTSPTYGVKVPALSVALEVDGLDAVKYTSEFILRQ
jgi:asparagine synthase (glutamine-hydrolysing)